jgi:signal peptidase I
MILLAGAAATVLAVCVLSIMLARRWFAVVTVSGSSMAPTLRPGDRVLVRRHPHDALSVLRAGAIVVFREPGAQRRPGFPASGLASQPWVIKRIAAMPGHPVPGSVRPAVGDREVVPAGMLVVLGDGLLSGDSRQWGFIPADQTLGLVVRTLKATRDSSA